MPFLTIGGEGVFAHDLFASASGGRRLVETTIALSASQMAALAADGTISFEVTPSIDVLNDDFHLEQNNLTLRLSYRTEGTRLIGDFIAPTAGTYLARIAGAEASYSLLVTHGAQFDIEPNDNLVTAHDLTFSGTVLGAVSPSVTKTVDRPTISEDFESGSLSGAWTTFSSTPEGHIEVTDSETVAAGDFALLMKSTRSGNLNEAIWTVDLSGASGARINFFYFSFGIDFKPFEGDFVGSFNADGVAISDDGVTWHPVLNSRLTGTSWRPFVIDLAAAAGEAGMTLGPNFKIKFQHFGTGLQEERRGYDEITLVTQTLIDLPDDDFYSVQAVAGDLLQLSTIIPGGGPGQPVNNLDVAIELFDPVGALVESDPDGALSHLATMTGTYTVHVLGENGTAGEYVLTVSGHSGSPPPPGAVAVATAPPTTDQLALDATISTEPMSQANVPAMDGPYRLSREQIYDAALAAVAAELELEFSRWFTDDRRMSRGPDRDGIAPAHLNAQPLGELGGEFDTWQTLLLPTDRDGERVEANRPKSLGETDEMKDRVNGLLVRGEAGTLLDHSTEVNVRRGQRRLGRPRDTNDRGR